MGLSILTALRQWHGDRPQCHAQILQRQPALSVREPMMTQAKALPELDGGGELEKIFSLEQVAIGIRLERYLNAYVFFSKFGC
ncbi:hypothetical protein H6F93_00020 [Leptolyngbya sp. FACHB-671]|uniref:hypothetical protein n=1 Tax=Leptolyngbya sp. FACHB-671 TaxID=2692812 RepID=UPI001685F762|nr:hypothetical protein [Leptolyngbya sp. FACHB-671]MBD2065940.1 hypothetical protein [Leptolyngbya sp. FACHB-671]